MASLAFGPVAATQPNPPGGHFMGWILPSTIVPVPNAGEGRSTLSPPLIFIWKGLEFVIMITE